MYYSAPRPLTRSDLGKCVEITRKIYIGVVGDRGFFLGADTSSLLYCVIIQSLVNQQQQSKKKLLHSYYSYSTQTKNNRPSFLSYVDSSAP